jgi:hypothetical protein
VDQLASTLVKKPSLQKLLLKTRDNHVHQRLPVAQGALIQEAVARHRIWQVQVSTRQN